MGPCLLAELPSGISPASESESELELELEPELLTMDRGRVGRPSWLAESESPVMPASFCSCTVSRLSRAVSITSTTLRRCWSRLAQRAWALPCGAV